VDVVSRENLFENWLSAQCQCYFYQWLDQSAKATDAFLKVWTHIKGHPNPPWNLVGKALIQVQTQQATIVLIDPVWKLQPWYPTILHILTFYPRLITLKTEIMVNRDNSLILPQLTIWHISEKIQRPNFWKKL